MPQDLLTDFSDVVEPAHTALLAIDVLNDFCAPGGHTEARLGRDVAACQAVVEPIEGLAAAARRAGVPVVWIKADYDRAYLSPPIHARQVARGMEKAYCVSGTWGAGFYRVNPEDGDLVIEKHRHSAFAGTELDQMLRDRGIRTVAVAGVQTHVCVESTLRDASARGYYVVVPRDCVGSYDRDLHDKTLRCVEMHFGEVVESADLVARWRAIERS